MLTQESRWRFSSLKVTHQMEAKERRIEIFRLKNVELVQIDEELMHALSEIETRSGLLPSVRTVEGANYRVLV